LERELRALNGAPSIIIGNAGEVNAGDFDPIETLADLAEEYGAWYHVDGAFGLFARVSPKSEHLARGAERAHSVCVDGHKWLNVPYDCGFGFVSDTGLLSRAFAYTADYLVQPDDPQPNFGVLGPESSRRSRSLAVWATLRAYGRQGYQEMVEGHLSLAQHLARLVDDAPDLERLAAVPLNIVCFRYNPGGLSDEELDRLNERLGGAILTDGRVYAGTTLYEGAVALRPAISNWRTRQEDIELLVRVVRELGERTRA
jgi:glutamate/tyrosine decarboxylase-like PLP-dependent enzyme